MRFALGLCAIVGECRCQKSGLSRKISIRFSYCKCCSIVFTRPALCGTHRLIRSALIYFSDPFLSRNCYHIEFLIYCWKKITRLALSFRPFLTPHISLPASLSLLLVPSRSLTRALSLFLCPHSFRKQTSPLLTSQTALRAPCHSATVSTLVFSTLKQDGRSHDQSRIHHSVQP